MASGEISILDLSLHKIQYEDTIKMKTELHFFFTASEAWERMEKEQKSTTS